MTRECTDCKGEGEIYGPEPWDWWHGSSTTCRRPAVAETKPFEARPARREWVAHGLRCALVDAPIGGAINGYVRTPTELSTEQVAQIEVHGGVTYEGREWVGFDTLHGGDVWPGSDLMGPTGHDWDVYWDEEKVVAETERFAAEVKRVMEL